MKKIVPDPPMYQASKKAAWTSMVVACERFLNLPGLLLPGFAGLHATAAYPLCDACDCLARRGFAS
ncbi:hypothetical protein [Pseudomonas chlororaphis]|uniref:hypothetical protein n=1 Tax=Pseudomonas chlororaphis TaxID=587753 RepID=UPI0011D17B2F|nr:hypothetical protein [Pseudomonas chlororaphis]